MVVLALANVCCCACSGVALTAVCFPSRYLALESLMCCLRYFLPDCPILRVHGADSDCLHDLGGTMVLIWNFCAGGTPWL